MRVVRSIHELDPAMQERVRVGFLKRLLKRMNQNPHVSDETYEQYFGINRKKILEACPQLAYDKSVMG